MIKPKKERWIAHNQDGMPERVKWQIKVILCSIDGSTTKVLSALWFDWCDDKIIAYQIIE